MLAPHEEETGEAPVVVPGFAADVEQIIRDRGSP
jgi:hypothetical protein